MMDSSSLDKETTWKEKLRGMRWSQSVVTHMFKMWAVETHQMDTQGSEFLMVGRSILRTKTSFQTITSPTPTIRLAECQAHLSLDPYQYTGNAKSRAFTFKVRTRTSGSTVPKVSCIGKNGWNLK